MDAMTMQNKVVVELRERSPGCRGTGFARPLVVPPARGEDATPSEQATGVSN